MGLHGKDIAKQWAMGHRNQNKFLEKIADINNESKEYLEAIEELKD